jgi:hypothetical protein
MQLLAVPGQLTARAKPRRTGRSRMVWWQPAAAVHRDSVVVLRGSLGGVGGSFLARRHIAVAARLCGAPPSLRFAQNAPGLSRRPAPRFAATRGAASNAANAANAAAQTLRLPPPLVPRAPPQRTRLSRAPLALFPSRSGTGSKSPRGRENRQQQQQRQPSPLPACRVPFRPGRHAAALAPALPPRPVGRAGSHGSQGRCRAAAAVPLAAARQPRSRLGSRLDGRSPAARAAKARQPGQAVRPSCDSGARGARQERRGCGGGLRPPSASRLRRPI